MIGCQVINAKTSWDFRFLVYPGGNLKWTNDTLSNFNWVFFQEFCFFLSYTGPLYGGSGSRSKGRQVRTHTAHRMEDDLPTSALSLPALPQLTCFSESARILLLKLIGIQSFTDDVQRSEKKALWHSWEDISWGLHQPPGLCWLL